MDGALLIDKAQGCTSATVVRRIKKHFQLPKVGHAGTLDPMATGLLVVLSGKATRLQDLVMGGNKTYSGTIALGIATDSDDVTGRVIETDDSLLTALDSNRERITLEIKAVFSGWQQQLPPQVSAVKVDGKRSYALARAGEQVELKAREVYLELRQLDFIEPTKLQYEVYCSKGTYIRSLARDIGKFLGSCAALESIRRLGSEPFVIDNARCLEQVLDSPLEDSLLPPQRLVQHLPLVLLDAAASKLIRLGNQRPLLDICPSEEASGRLTALIDQDNGDVIGIIEKNSSEENSGWQLRMVF